MAVHDIDLDVQNYEPSGDDEVLVYFRGDGDNIAYVLNGNRVDIVAGLVFLADKDENMKEAILEAAACLVAGDGYTVKFY